MGHESYQRHESLKTSSNRVFGLVFAAVFVAVALVPLISGGQVRSWSLGVGSAFLVLALAFPSVLGPLNRAWMRLGLLLHKIVNPVILGIMFFLIITPAALLMRTLGKDPLRLKRDRGANTYWIARTPPGPAPESLDRQF